MTLEQAIKAVDTLGLAPLARISAAMPKDYISDAYQRWNVRRYAVELEVIEKLRAQGATITLQGDSIAHIRFAGVGASSTIGLPKALKNWKANAGQRAAARRRYPSRSGGKR